MIKISEVSFQYNSSSEVISNLSLLIPKESCIAIIGNSGCGKSTLLNLISGILKPSKGNITVHTNRLAYLMQDLTLLPYKTVLENVLLARLLRNKFIDEETRQRAINLLKLFLIEDNSFAKFPHELSGGMTQRIGIAQTLLTDPELLLLDEPFNAIDVNALNTIEEYVWNYIKNRKCTMVFITHNIEQALVLSDKVLIMGKNHTIHQVVPSDNYIVASPSRRVSMAEFNMLFMEAIEKMKL